MNHEQRTTNNEPRTDVRTWSFDRKVNLSVLVQLVILASLIVGSWVNLQRQLDSLQRDVTMLLDSNKGLQDRLETVSARSISYEYRLRALEKHSGQADAATNNF
jgi:hypothetical protein